MKKNFIIVSCIILFPFIFYALFYILFYTEYGIVDYVANTFSVMYPCLIIQFISIGILYLYLNKRNCI